VSATTSDTHQSFAVNRGFPTGVARDVTIEVEYLDESAGRTVGLEYDGAAGAYEGHPLTIVTTGTNRWRHVRFEVGDGVFGSHEEGNTDFRIVLSGPVHLNRIWLRLPE
jgi:hypothetical protein